MCGNAGILAYVQNGGELRYEPVTGWGAILPARRRNRRPCPAVLSSLRSLLSFILQFMNGHLSALATTRVDSADFETLAVQRQSCLSIKTITSMWSSFSYMLRAKI